MENMLKFGPTAMKGEIWEEKLVDKELVEILVTHQEDCINSIQFTYRGGYLGREFYQSQTYGEPNGLRFNMVEVNGCLTSVSGKLIDGRLASIVFGSNEKTYGPFGGSGSSSGGHSYEDFKYEIKPGRFGGFHGSVNDGSVYAIGVYVKPLVAPKLNDDEINLLEGLYYED